MVLWKRQTFGLKSSAAQALITSGDRRSSARLSLVVKLSRESSRKHFYSPTKKPSAREGFLMVLWKRLELSLPEATCT